MQGSYVNSKSLTDDIEEKGLRNKVRGINHQRRLRKRMISSSSKDRMIKIEEEKEKAVQAARNTLKKDKRINLRLSQKDYRQIQLKAIEEGMPYQTLIASIIHKYLNGSLSPRETYPK